MAYLTVNQHVITRKVGLTEPEAPPGSEQWAPNSKATDKLSLDEVAAVLREKNKQEMFPPALKSRAVVYCSEAEAAKRPTGAVPQIYADTCRRLGLSAAYLAEAFGENGFHVEKCFSAWKGGQTVLEVWKVDIYLSPSEPLLKIHFLKHNTYKLLLPDLYLHPLTHPEAVDCFAHYQWPNGDRELFDIRHTYCVLASFRNVREPVLFVSDDEIQRTKLETIITVVAELAKVEHCARRQRLRYEIDLPTSIGREGDDTYDSTINEQFAEVVHESALRLGTTAACAKFWRRSRRTWVFEWTGKKYNAKKFYLTIHRSSPHLMFFKRDGHTRQAFSKELDYTSSCLSRCFSSIQQRKSWSAFMRSPKSHIAFIDNINDSVPRLFFSFETSEDLKDFQQVVATLGYIQLRLEACPLTASILNQYNLSSPRAADDRERPPADEMVFNENAPAYYTSPLTFKKPGDAKRHPRADDVYEPEGGNLQDSQIFSSDGVPMIPRRAPMGTLFSRPPSTLDAEINGSGQVSSALLRARQKYSGAGHKLGKTDTRWEDACFPSANDQKSRMKDGHIMSSTEEEDDNTTE